MRQKIRKNFYLFRIFIFFKIFLFRNIIFAQSFIGQNILPNLIYYDAESITINKNEKTIYLDNNVIFLIGNVYLSAHKIFVNQNQGLIVAEGQVKLINGLQKATASRILFDIKLNQFKMENAEIFSDPTMTSQKVSEEILGVTHAEIAFDQERFLKAKEIENQLKFLREEYSNVQNLNHVSLDQDYNKIINKINELKKKYSQLLRRFVRTRYQPNAILAALPHETREKLLERRDAVQKFNQENSELAKKISSFSNIKGYLKIAASEIIQKDKDTFLLNNSIITTCHCSSSDSSVLYSFSSQKAKIEIGDYITMQDVTLDVFSVPIFYSPWLKFPIKNKRESGFLMPSGYTTNNAGSATSIPFFLVLGPSADNTITYEYFSQRGSQFTNDFRLRFGSESLFKLEAKFIQDKFYQKSWESNNLKVDQAIANESDPMKKKIYNSYRGQNLDTRWYFNNSINIPLKDDWSLKGNTQFVSDNNYLSDFSNSNSSINSKASVFGDTSASSKRFLNQEVDGEYYGENIVFSVRAQGLRDLFAQSSDQTPLRMPRIEFHLLPKRYFEMPVIFGNSTSWENIVRPNGQSLISTHENPFSPSEPPFFDQNNIDHKNLGQSNVSGQRFSSASVLNLPLQANDYINASASATVVGTQYYFSDTTEKKNAQPALSYAMYKLHVDMPFYGLLNLNELSSFCAGHLRHDFKPFVDFTYIPSILKSYNFPSTYQLWYSEDNVVSTATATLGFQSSWTIEKESFLEEEEPLARLSKAKKMEVADFELLNKSVQDQHLKNSLDTQNIFQFSSNTESLQVFDVWAQKELENYYKIVSQEEENQNYFWPEKNYYVKKTLWKLNPLQVSVYTGYNFLAAQTASELNANAGPFVAPVPMQKYTDIITMATLNLRPIFPFSTSFKTAYNQFYHRLNSSEIVLSSFFPFGLHITYTNQQQFVLNPKNQKDFVKKIQQTVDTTYSPLKWLQLGYQWAKNIDPTVDPLTNLSAGRDYAYSQNIVFLNLKNCLDVALARNKPAGTPEHLATYVISLNFRIFGYERKIDQVGDYFNRLLQH